MAVDLSSILGALGQFGQSNAVRSQRIMQAQQQRAGALQGVGTVAGGVLGGMFGGPVGAAAGSALGGAAGNFLGGGQGADAGQLAQNAMSAYSIANQYQGQKAQGTLVKGMLGQADQGLAQQQRNLAATAGSDPNDPMNMGALSRVTQQRAQIKELQGAGGFLPPQALGILQQQLTPQFHSLTPGSQGLLYTPMTGDVSKFGSSSIYRPLSTNEFKQAFPDAPEWMAKQYQLNTATNKIEPLGGRDPWGAATETERTIMRTAMQAYPDDPEAQKTFFNAQMRYKAEQPSSTIGPGGLPVPVAGQNWDVGVAAVGKPPASPLTAGRPNTYTKPPVPKEEAEETQRSVNMLGMLGQFYRNSGYSGPVTGTYYKYAKYAGLSPDEAVQNEQIESRMVELGTNIFGKRITNFDVGKIDQMIPHPQLPESVNRARIEGLVPQIKQGIINDIAGYRAKEYQLPPGLEQAAKDLGIDVKKVTKDSAKEIQVPDTKEGSQINPKTSREDAKSGEFYLDKDGNIAKKK